MTAQPANGRDTGDRDEALDELLDALASRVQRGEPVDVEELVRAHPEHAAPLRQVLPAMRLLADIGQSPLDACGEDDGEESAAGRLGDFRLLREVGRGGMGVVYEAEQISLRRRVALKVLPFAATMDPRQLVRFRNEALAAASLEHPHIVPVYGVGQERGVHYYAMKFIDGQTLADFIHAHKQGQPVAPPNAPAAGSAAEVTPGSPEFIVFRCAACAASMKTRAAVAGKTIRCPRCGAAIPIPAAEPARLARVPLTANGATEAYRPPAAAAAASPNKTGDAARPLPSGESGRPAAETKAEAGAGGSTRDSHRTRAYFANVARLGIQAAEALEHAHQLGIVHRDVKPANLMLDGRGELWVTDFGLARIGADAGLTMTGDLLGTLRYMSPEQALAKHGLVDHRTDIYALGATLYELLTLRPAIDGKDRQEILTKIANDDPAPPRKLNRAVPADLETIVLKALSKEPRDRYSSARELAEDLRHFLEHKPIRARKPGWVRRVRQLARRHRAAVWAGGLALLFAVVALAGSVGWVVRGQLLRQEQTEEAVNSILGDIDKLHAQKDWFRARELARHAQSLLQANGGGEDLKRKVAELLRDYDMAIDLEDIHLQIAQIGQVQDGGYDRIGGAKAYRSRFEKDGIDLFGLDPAEAAALIRSRSIAAELVEAIDQLAWIHHDFLKDPAWKRLLTVARLADPDEWANEVRDTLVRKDLQALKVMASADRAATLSWAALNWVCLTLSRDKAHQHLAASLWRKAQQHQPNNLWINLHLATFLFELNPPEVAESVRYFQAGLALRPNSAGIYVQLGCALHLDPKKRDESMSCILKAIALKPDYPHAHWCLGIVYRNKGQLDEAIASFRKAVALQPDYAEALSNLGSTLEAKGQMEEAIACYQKIIALKPDFAQAHCNLGDAYKRDGQFLEALKSYRRGHELGSKQPGWPYPSAQWVQHCEVLLQKDGKLAEVLKGSFVPPHPTEFCVFAKFCWTSKRQYAASAGLYQKAFAAQPDLAKLPNPNRYFAAFAAVMAGVGQGKDAAQLTDKEKAAWRKQALDWLRADLDEWSTMVQEAQPKKIFLAVRKLEEWQQAKFLSGVRDAAPLAKLPGPERKEWQKLWSDVNSLLESAGDLHTDTTIADTVTTKASENSHKVQMTAGHVYVIDLKSQAFNASLRLDGPDGKLLLQGHVSGGGQDARLDFTPTKSGTYRIMATSSLQKGAGSYTLTIREFHGKKAEKKPTKTPD